MPTIDGGAADLVARWEKAYNAVEAAAGKKRPTSGVITCPNCQGQLAYSVAWNGHTMGRCATAGCTKWIE